MTEDDRRATMTGCVADPDGPCYHNWICWHCAASLASGKDDDQ